MDPVAIKKTIGMNSGLTYAPLSLVMMALCAIAALYAWISVIYSFQKTTYQVIEQRAALVKRILIIVFLLALLSSVIGMISNLPDVAAASPETKSSVLQRGLDRLLLRESFLTVLAGFVGLGVIRGRASYLKPN